MQTLMYLSLALLAALAVNNFLLIRRIQKAVELQRLPCPDLAYPGLGGGPIGLLFNLFRWRKIPVTNDLSDPDHVAIRFLYRAQQTFFVLLAGCLAVGLILGVAA